MASRNKHNKADGRRLRRNTQRDCRNSQRYAHAKRGAYYDQARRQELNLSMKNEFDDVKNIFN